jgi:hypothetical protein
VAEYETSDDEAAEKPSLFLKLRNGVKTDREAQGAWRKEARLDFGFYAGGEQQWDKGVIDDLDANDKPWTSFNFIAPSVSAVTGMEVANRQRVTYLPRTTQAAPQQPMQPGMPGQPPVPGANDQGPAETLTAANNYLRDQCDAEDEESEAFQDVAICGMGWTETRIDYEDNPEGELRVDRCDPLEMGWDAQATKRNLADARRFHRVREMDCDAAKEMFPGYELSEIDAGWARGQQGDDQPHDADDAKFYRGDGETYHRKTVTVVEVTWFETEKAFRVADLTTGQVTEVDEAKLKTLRERAKQVGLRIAVKTETRKAYKYAFLGAESILGDDQEGTPCQSQKGFKFQPITGWRDRNKKQWLGIVRGMRDPQRWANALYSSTLNTVMTSGKGIMAERDAFEKPDQAEVDWAQSGNIVWLKTGALSGANPKIKEKVPTPLPAGIDRMMEFALQALFRVSGVNLETLGAADRNQAASLEYQRRQSATTILAPFFDGLRRYRKVHGRLTMDLIKEYLSDGRLIRVVGPDYEQYVPLIRDDSVAEYDIIVGESPTSPNQKEASWAIIQQMLPMIGANLGPGATAALLKASPLPESVVKEFKQTAEQEQQAAANAPPPPEVQLTMAQIEKTKAETALKQQDAQIRQFETAATVETTRMDIQDRAAERQHKERMRGFDMQSAAAERQGAVETEFAKSAGPALPEKFDALAQGLAALGQGIQQGLAAQAQAIGTLAQSVAAPRVTEMVDPVTGQVMRATSAPVTVQ